MIKKHKDKFYENKKVHRVKTYKNGTQKYIAYAFQEVTDGKAVTVPGFEGFEFFVHGNGRSISEATTGGSVFSSTEQLTDAELANHAARLIRGDLAKAATEIADFSGGKISDYYGEALKERIGLTIEKFGLSPRYIDLGKKEDF